MLSKINVIDICGQKTLYMQHLRNRGLILRLIHGQRSQIGHRRAHHPAKDFKNPRYFHA